MDVAEAGGVLEASNAAADQAAQAATLMKGRASTSAVTKAAMATLKSAKADVEANVARVAALEPQVRKREFFEFLQVCYSDRYADRRSTQIIFWTEVINGL
jgi:hypothetical protein